ncbi:MAG: hypothetical protein DMG06_17635 [Acidobacteria bacterium]|nr:MAG: hypothetical protein DMG06_17635 [Acidobacteriota bacterium]
MYLEGTDYLSGEEIATVSHGKSVVPEGKNGCTSKEGTLYFEGKFVVLERKACGTSKEVSRLEVPMHQSVTHY